jgi:hypothetical protein
LGSLTSLTPSSGAGIAQAPAREEQHAAEAALYCYEGQPPSDAPAATLVIPDRRDEFLGTITFENDGPDSRGLSSEERFALREDICREKANLERWANDHGWQHTWPQLHVVVADRYRISKSLVPAWNGRNGRMELPASRVANRKAAVMHELVHLLFPNANRFLAEGLAVYLQAEIGSNPAFPNFGRPLHVVTREILQQLVSEFEAAHPGSFDPPCLTELDVIATPAPLALHLGSNFYGEEPRGQGRIYPLVGSFTQFLVATRGLELFHSIYSQTPLVAHRQSAGPAERWLSVYGCSLADLEQEWKSKIASREAGGERTAARK